MSGSVHGSDREGGAGVPGQGLGYQVVCMPWQTSGTSFCLFTPADPSAPPPLPPPSQDVPTAYAYELEAATIVQSSQVVEAVERTCGAKQLAAA